MELKIEETSRTTHELLTVGGQRKAEFVDIARAEDGELLSVHVGSTEISPDTWEILQFLQKEGKL
jgi:hypothetical protein